MMKNFAVVDDSIETLLEERDLTHGDYDTTARIIQNLKRLIHQEAGWNDLNAQQKEALDMICSKIGRIMAGNQSFRDHWDDIAGYAVLVANRIVNK